MSDLKEQILSKYETYVTLTQPHNTTPIFLKENVLEAMEEYANEILKQAYVVVDNPEKVLHIQHVSNSVSSCSFIEVKDIWNAAEKYVLHEIGEICKGDANYEEDIPDLNTYYERHYY
jgi:hypothetical protein